MMFSMNLPPNDYNKDKIGWAKCRLGTTNGARLTKSTSVKNGDIYFARSYKSDVLDEVSVPTCKILRSYDRDLISTHDKLHEQVFTLPAMSKYEYGVEYVLVDIETKHLLDLVGYFYDDSGKAVTVDNLDKSLQLTTVLARISNDYELHNVEYIREYAQGLSFKPVSQYQLWTGDSSHDMAYFHRITLIVYARVNHTDANGNINISLNYTITGIYTT